MLEVFGIMMLCKLNKKNAIARGRRPGGYIALTICLWVGLEIIGFIIGAMTDLQYGYALLGYGFAGIGALISFLCAKFGPQGDYVDPNAAPTMSSPAGTPYMGTYNVPIDQSNYAPYPNSPAAGVTVDQYGMPVNTKLNEFGMPVDDQGNYKPVLNQYGVPIDPTAINAPQPLYQATPMAAAPVAQQAPAQAAPVQKKFCSNCGAPVTASDIAFCESCGAKL